MGEPSAGPPDGFDVATAVQRVGDGSYEAVLDEAYTVVGNPNGGYLLALAARAAGDHLAARGTNHPHCLAASGSFIRAPKCGPAQVHVEAHRSGARISHLGVTIAQGGRVAVDALLSCGRLDVDPHVAHPGPDPVVLPPVESCDRVLAGGPPGEGISIMDRVELRLDPATTGFARGELTGDAEVRGWLRLADGRRCDPLGLLFACDALPPATLPIGSTGWVPTIQLSVYIRGIPAPGWLVARQHARMVTGGLVDEVCELWDSSGMIVAQAMQLAMVRFG